jgi:hypothetical protein
MMSWLYHYMNLVLHLVTSWSFLIPQYRSFLVHPYSWKLEHTFIEIENTVIV